MVRSAAVTNRIQEFFSMATLYLMQLAINLSEDIENYDEIRSDTLIEDGFMLLSMMTSLDSQLNDWPDKEVEDFLDVYIDRYGLKDYPATVLPGQQDNIVILPGGFKQNEGGGGIAQMVAYQNSSILFSGGRWRMVIPGFANSLTIATLEEIIRDSPSEKATYSSKKIDEKLGDFLLKKEASELAGMTTEERETLNTLDNFKKSFGTKDPAKLLESSLFNTLGGLPQIDPKTGKIREEFIPLPDGVDLKFQTGWDASTNTPAIPLTNLQQYAGHYYIVEKAGETDIFGQAEWKVWDRIVCDGTTWKRYPTGETASQQQGDGVFFEPTNLELGASDIYFEPTEL